MPLETGYTLACEADDWEPLSLGCVRGGELSWPCIRGDLVMWNRKEVGIARGRGLEIRVGAQQNTGLEEQVDALHIP